MTSVTHDKTPRYCDSYFIVNKKNNVFIYIYVK